MSVGSSSNSTGTAKVKKEVLKDVVKNYTWRVNNKSDRYRSPLPVEKIIQNAERLIDMEIPCNVFGNVCEHLVTLLRYDNKISDQLRNTISGISSFGAYVISCILLTTWKKLSVNKSVRTISVGSTEELENEERKIIDDLTEKVALLTTEILDTLSQTYARNIK
uniref:LRAT domain-containing protein n=1 Tax=Cyanoderma ruficeps TaxID=181631 RepID=A0A8C3QG34_9PASS